MYVLGGSRVLFTLHCRLISTLPYIMGGFLLKKSVIFLGTVEPRGNRTTSLLTL